VDSRSPEFIAADAATQRVRRVEERIQILQGAERDLLELMSGEGRSSALPGYSFLDDPEKIETLNSISTGTTRLPTLQQGGLALGQYLSADEVAAMIGSALSPMPMLSMAASGFDDTGAPSLREGTSRGIIPQLQRRLTFLDLIPAIPVDGKSTDYVQELGNLDTAAETAEGAVKPVGEARYEDEEAEHKTIAHYLKMPRQTLADSEDLDQRLRNRSREASSAVWRPRSSPATEAGRTSAASCRRPASVRSRSCRGRLTPIRSSEASRTSSCQALSRTSSPSR
jgi:hypothetical protein